MSKVMSKVMSNVNVMSKVMSNVMSICLIHFSMNYDKLLVEFFEFRSYIIRMRSLMPVSENMNYSLASNGGLYYRGNYVANFYGCSIKFYDMGVFISKNIISDLFAYRFYNNNGKCILETQNYNKNLVKTCDVDFVFLNDKILVNQRNMKNKLDSFICCDYSGNSFTYNGPEFSEKNFCKE